MNRHDRPSGAERAARLGYVLVLLALTLALFGPSLAQHWKHSGDPNRFADDVLQWVVPFLHYHDSALFAEDYCTGYFLAAAPAGYRFLYGTVSRFADPLAVTGMIHFFLLGLVLAGVFLAAYRLSGWTGAFLAAAICLSADIYLEKMAGGLPRGWALPLFSLGMAAVVWGRLRLFALATLLAAALYPLIAVVFSITLFLWLLLLPPAVRNTGEKAGLLRRLFFLAAVGTGVVLLTLPPVIRLKPYGPAIRPSETETYPEAGPGGRLRSTDHPPFAGLTESARVYAEESFAGSGTPVSASLRSIADRGGRGSPASPRRMVYITFLLLGLTGSVILVAGRKSGRRLLLLFGSAVAAHTLSLAAAPMLFIPERYVAYTLPPLLAVALPASLAAIGGVLFTSRRRPWARPAFTLLLGGLFLGLFGSRGSTHAGLTVHMTGPVLSFYEFVADLPKDVVIAGMPDGPVNYLPYMSRRKVLLSFENHHVFYREYTEEMRRRMRGLLRGYYATTMKPLRALRDRYGATHLLVNTRDYERPPRYFIPFDAMILEGFRRAVAEGSQALELTDKAGVFSFEDYTLLDLSRID